MEYIYTNLLNYLHFQQQSRTRTNQTPGRPLRSYTPVIAKPMRDNIQQHSTKSNVPNIAVQQVKKVEESFTEEDSFEEIIRAEMDNLETSLSQRPSAQKVQVGDPAQALQKEGCSVNTPNNSLQQANISNASASPQLCSVNEPGISSKESNLTSWPVSQTASINMHGVNVTPLSHQQRSLNTPLTSRPVAPGGTSTTTTPRETIPGSSFNTPSEDPVIARKRALQKQKFMRLAQYGTPSNLTTLNSPIPQTVRSAFKPPSMNSSNTPTGPATLPRRGVVRNAKENINKSESKEVPKMESLSPLKDSDSTVKNCNQDSLENITNSNEKETVKIPLIDSVNTNVDKNEQNGEGKTNVTSAVNIETNPNCGSETKQGDDIGGEREIFHSAIESNTGSSASCDKTDVNEAKCVKDDSNNIAHVTDESAKTDDLVCSQTSHASEASISSVVSDGALVRPKRGRPRKRQRTGSLSEAQPEVKSPPTKRRSSLRLSRSKKVKS